MDIDQHVNQIVQNIVEQITTQVQQQAISAIEQKVAEVIGSIDCMPIIAEKINQKIDSRLSQLPIDSSSIESEIKTRLGKLTNNLAGEIQARSLEAVKLEVSSIISTIDFQTVYKSTVLEAVQQGGMNFPPRSIPALAINIDDLSLTGNNIKGGIVEKFGSTGIDDQATACQLTILDDVTVVENNLLTKDLTVKGTTTIEGDLVVTGSIPQDSPMYQSIVRDATNNVRVSMDDTVFANFSDFVFKKIQETGIDLSKLSLNGQLLIDGGNLNNTVTYSNLQKVGVLSELQVSGESLLSQTLYTNSKRVGINTLEPTQALSVWDQEVEIGIGKLESNTGVIGSSRNHRLVLSTNNKPNLVLNPDGSVQASKISVGSVSLSSSATPPNTNSPQGTIVFNATPTLGGPLGWVSLGDAKWANFGFID